MSGTIAGVFAGGDLTGTYPDPLIADGRVTNAKLTNSSLRVNAGTGLSGGGPASVGGSQDLSVDPTVVQSRVTGTCSVGPAVSSINQNGTVTCASTASLSVLSATENTAVGLTSGVGSAVPFNTPGVTAGTAISQPNSTSFTLNSDGVYHLTIKAETATLSLLGSLQVTVNGTGVPIIGHLNSSGAPIVLDGLISASAGDVVQVVDEGLALTFPVGTPISVTVVKVS
jgi:hypothetical protein